MTILFVTHYPGFYGANKSLLMLMVLLREHHGINPIVLLPSKGAMCGKLEEAGIPYKVSHYYWWVNYNHGVFQWLLNKRKQLINHRHVGKICNLFKKENIDLVYTNSICVNMGFLIAERLGLPHVWQARETFEQFSLSLSLSLSRSKAIWDSPVNKKYILISDYMKNSYMNYLPADRMVKVHNGVDLPQGIFRKNTNVLKGRLQIACMGVLSEQKNQLEILKAQKVLLNRGVEVVVWLLGVGQQEYTDKLRQFTEQSGLNDLIHFVGHTDDVFQMLQNMNLGVVAAHDEAFGRVTLEYMLMQMPVVASRSGANAELITPGETGEIYPLGDVEALADAIEQYVKHPELLEKQGKVGEQTAKNNFSAGKNAENIYEQIKTIIS